MEITQSQGWQQAPLANAFAGQQAQNSAMPPPPPPPQDELSGFMVEAKDDEDVRSFMQSIMDMEQSGEFDAATVAASAPDSLKAYAQENGIDLESFFQQKHDDFVSRREQAPNQPDTPAQAYSQTADLNSNSSNLLSALTSSLSVNTQA